MSFTGRTRERELDEDETSPVVATAARRRRIGSSAQTSAPALPFGTVMVVAGTSGPVGFADGPARAARFCAARGVCVVDAPPADHRGDGGAVLLITDAANRRIRTLRLGDSSPERAAVTTLAGSGRRGFADGVGADAEFSFPIGCGAFFREGGGAAARHGQRGEPLLLVADEGCHAIRAVTMGGGVSLFAGEPGRRGDDDGAARSGARFNSPCGLAVDPRGGAVFVSEVRARTHHAFRAQSTHTRSIVSTSRPRSTRSSAKSTNRNRRSKFRRSTESNGPRGVWR